MRLHRDGKTQCGITCHLTNVSSSYRKGLDVLARVITGRWIPRRSWCLRRARSGEDPGDFAASANRRLLDRSAGSVMVIKRHSTTSTSTIITITRIYSCNNSNSITIIRPSNSNNRSRCHRRSRHLFCHLHCHHSHHSSSSSNQLSLNHLRNNHNHSHSQRRVTCTISTTTRTPQLQWSRDTTTSSNSNRTTVVVQAVEELVSVVVEDTAAETTSWTILRPAFGRAKSLTVTSEVQVVTKNSLITVASITWLTTMVSTHLFFLQVNPILYLYKSLAILII